MTIEIKNAILSIGECKLCIAINPEIEIDRGYIKFFDSSQSTSWNDGDIINTTELHGNGLIPSIADEAINHIQNGDFTEITDKNLITQADGLSWYNANNVDSSLCVFRYIDSSDNVQKRAAVVLTDFSDFSDVNSFLRETIKTSVVVSVPDALRI